MPKIKMSKYWAFQTAGWGAFAVINVGLVLFIFQAYNIRSFQRLLFFMAMGLMFSHIMREVIRSSGLLMKSIQQQVIRFTILIITFALLAATAVTPFEYIYTLRTNNEGQPYPYKELFYSNFGSFLSLYIIWNAIYFIYHFVKKSRKQQMDTIKLEALVKELELKTIKAHINPHFIFNALNGIRALIDEDPQRARRAVTELSNILRSSLKAEKGETISFSDELKIVKDYLALENMRFEDRLQVEYDVEEETLEQQVPPMMLQTLVENAIKHGISKQIKGGMVKIISDFRGNYHELAVQNTGHLNGASGSTGFGLSSTRDRLQLLYGEKARFQIAQVDPDLVEAKVLIPILLN